MVYVILTADMHLDPNLPGRRILGNAVIAPYPDAGPEQGRAVAGER